MAEKLPIVAIIGQANAGKSALFNRMRKENQAIVAREAGTTRDNVMGKVLHRGYNFWLVDTAGLKDPADEFEESIQDQIAEAIETADLILFVKDSTLYTNNEDLMLSRSILRKNKKSILVLNKIDLKESLPATEFMSLGMQSIIRVSAEHSTGIDDLLDAITKNIEKSHDEKQNDDILRIALIGRPNVGKSNLFNTLAGKQQAIVANIAGTTRDVNRVTIKYEGTSVELLDTAGIRRQGKQEVGIEKFSVLRSLNAIEYSDICLLLMDVNELNTQLDQRLAGIIEEAGKGLIIVVTKWDSVKDKTDKTRDELAKDIANTFNFTLWAPLIFTSSITGQNVTKILELAKDIDARRKQKVKTSVLNDILQKTIKKHQPAGLKNTHPKLKYIVQTDTTPPWFVIYGSNLTMVHWSYKRYLENQIREQIDYVGTPIEISFRSTDNKKTKNEDNSSAR
jgi:GTP-binding protein